LYIRATNYTRIVCKFWGPGQMKEVEYWGLIGIIGPRGIKVRTVLRRVGDGNITFWSVMLYSKIKSGNQKLFTEGIEEE